MGLEKTLESPLDFEEIKPVNQLIQETQLIQEIKPECSLEGLMLKLQYFGHLMQITESLERTLMLEKIEGRTRRQWQRVRWLDSITNTMDINLIKLGEIV